jgi:hypothetical protein
MRNTIDPVKCDHRLLVVYLAVKLMDFLVRLFLLYKGFNLICRIFLQTSRYDELFSPKWFLKKIANSICARDRFRSIIQH